MSASKTKTSMFDALANVEDATPTTAAIDELRADPTQPRTVFDQEELDNLAESIKRFGILSPILVSPATDGVGWMIVDGERRFRAAKMAGLTEVLINVREDFEEKNSDRDLAQLIANTNRSDLRDFEIAKALQKHLETDKTSGARGRLAKLINRPASAISRYLSMLDPQFMPLAEAGIIRSADAMARFRSVDKEVQDELVEGAKSSGQPLTELSIREAVKAKAGAPGEGTTGSTGPAPIDPAFENGGSTGPVQEAPADEAAASTGAGLATGSSGGGTSDENDDQGEDSASSGVTTTPASRGGKSPASSPATREKSVSLRLTGEAIEDLLRHFVDKASDQVELRLPADLAVAVIENLGGEVPGRADHYAEAIRDLLTAKYSR